jgi:hypothetical protein
MPEFLRDKMNYPVFVCKYSLLGLLNGYSLYWCNNNFMEIILFKSITYSSKLFFLLEILFWVGRNEQ